MGTVENILVVGVGGQGVIMASDLLADVALASGFAAKKSEIHGMSQRGGVVSSHVRYGREVHSPLIARGQADLLIAFELAEAVRWLDFVSAQGRVIASTQKVTPPLVSMGLARYPDEAEELIAQQGVKAHIVDAPALARELGNPRLVNTILLGLASNYLQLALDKWREVMERRLKPALTDINLQAFAQGRRWGNA
jgi:indolepyruvate ferredoxin oxidoreductase beta subunit